MIADTAWRRAALLGVCILNLFLLAGLAMGDNGVFTFLALRERHRGLETELARVEQDSRELSRDIRLLTSDPAYQEMAVRDELNYLRPGEVLYLFSDRTGPSAKGDGSAEEN